MSKTLIAPLRAPGFRESIAREFHIPVTIDGEPLPLTFIRIQADPRLIALSIEVHSEVRKQFAADGPGKLVETQDDTTYRIKLEGWADALEIMLEEVLSELERLKPMRLPTTEEMV
jgi:hypothetical protein